MFRMHVFKDVVGVLQTLRMTLIKPCQEGLIHFDAQQDQ